MKTNTITKTVAPALLLIACLLLPQTAQCFYNPSTGRWLSRDPLAERGGKNLYVLLRSDPVNSVDARGLKKCGILWMSVEWSKFHIFMVGPDMPRRGAATWLVNENVKFRKDAEYDPCCCEVQRLVAATATPLNLPSVEHDDGISRASNDSDPGWPGNIDCHRQDFHAEDNPSTPFDVGDTIDYSFTSTFIVSSVGKSYPAEPARGIPRCNCENHGEVARISHTVHLTGTFPNLDVNDTIPALLFLGTVPAGR
jgi:hypothetical protein